ncbi:arylamine N-acetyltransferase family protein [Phytohalomonas tamaricis]|uniref:arylamine N-acetyltransferase family protein n=1 Tax=Phytohalomonas tamaricis TaxID=2081032 RepID=UPI000D0AEE08|nr:arylamine N-acetyltransferase [Phytohalomonas tamaricis]
MTGMTPLDLDAYFSRIGYAGPHTATLDTLRAIHLCHTQTIAFENLDPLLEQPVRLDLESLQRKLITDARGGYCFEHNTLLQHALETLGFRVKGLAARVLWNAPQETPPHTHMLLSIDLDEGHYIADVGFGGMTLTAPLRLQSGEEQETPHETFRLQDTVHGGYLLQVRLIDGWRTLYQFDLQPQHPADYTMYNFYVSHYPESRFVHHLIAARPGVGHRYALLDNTLTVYPLGGEHETRRIDSVFELRMILEDTFGLRLPDTSMLDARLKGILKHSGQSSE